MRAREASLQAATPVALAEELDTLWSSMLGADVLLAGPMRREAAADLVSDSTY